MKVIFVDVDETVCDTPNNPRDYHSSIPREEVINKINALYNEGNKIIYWTARGGNSGIDWYEHTKEQLDSWGAQYHELRCDKPSYDIFYDDKTKRIEEL